MKNERLLVGGATLGLLAGGAMFAYAQGVPPGAAPRLIPYTGHLDHDGTPVTGTVAMKVCLVTDAATSCDTAPWVETRGAVPVAGGSFSLTLGEITPILDDTFKSALTTGLYIRVMVGASSDAGATFVQLSGAQRVLSAPYAINAEQASKLRMGGPIYSGATTPGTQDLGLYSEGAGAKIRLVTNGAAIQFSTDGALGNSWIGSGSEPATAVVSGGRFQLGVYVNEATGTRDIYCNPGDTAISGGGRCCAGCDQMWLESNAIRSGNQPVGWRGVCMNHDNSSTQDPPERVQVICLHHGI